MPLLKRIRNVFSSKAVVLMYHRIADVPLDPWQLAVSPHNFEKHLQVLQKIGNLITVRELVKGLHKKAIKDHSICLTFDDGYEDNYFQAKPLLEKYQSAASFFIPTLYPGQNRQFWWDELQSILLSYPKLPATFSLSIRGSLLEFNLDDDSVLTNDRLLQNQQWAWPATPPTRRCELYLAIWEKIKPLTYDEVLLVLAGIKQWALFMQPSDNDGLPITLEQLKDLTKHALIDLGIHTVTHPALSFHPIHLQRTEISDSKAYLENICSRSIDTMAYPYGDHNEITLAVAKELKLTAAFTTTEKVVTNDTDPYRIGRFQVRNWNEKDFERSIFKWQKSSHFI